MSLPHCAFGGNASDRADRLRRGTNAGRSKRRFEKLKAHWRGCKVGLCGKAGMIAWSLEYTDSIMRHRRQSDSVAFLSRRELLTRAGSGLGGLALAHLLTESGALAPLSAAVPDGHSLAAKTPHHAPRAKSVIWLFMEGGPSHIDLFDAKPELGVARVAEDRHRLIGNKDALIGSGAIFGFVRDRYRAGFASAPSSSCDSCSPLVGTAQGYTAS